MTSNEIISSPGTEQGKYFGFSFVKSVTVSSLDHSFFVTKSIFYFLM